MNTTSPYISTIDRQRLTTWIERARASENMVEDDLNLLEKKLATAQLCTPERIPADVVTMHSLIAVKNLQTGRAQRYKIMYPGTADESAGQISVLSPIGIALLGCRRGDIVEITTAAGPRPDRGRSRSKRSSIDLKKKRRTTCRARRRVPYSGRPRVVLVRAATLGLFYCDASFNAGKPCGT